MNLGYIEHNDLRIRTSIMYTIRYLASLGFVIIGCSMGYTMIVVWGITKIFPLNDATYWIVNGIVFTIIVTATLRFYIPRLRKIW